MTRYGRVLNAPGQTPQSHPLPGREAEMVKNEAGGWSFVVDAMNRLNRFLVLGVDSNTYYTDQKTLVQQNVTNVLGLIHGRGLEVVDEVVRVSVGGLAPRNDPAIFVLAACITKGDDETRTKARNAVNAVCRTPYHLATFLNAVKAFDGKVSRRVVTAAVRTFFQSGPVDRLTMHALKYRQREGWSMADLLRISHPKSEEEDRNALFRWITHRGDLMMEGYEPKDLPTWVKGMPIVDDDSVPEQVQAFEEAQATQDVKRLVKLITEYRLTWEMIPSEWLKDPNVWLALLENMPPHAVIRNLGRLSSLGVIGPGGSGNSLVLDVLNDHDRLSKARVHPMQALLASAVYSQGKGVRGSLTWSPFTRVLDALTDAFYGTFQGLNPTGKRVLVGVDGSGSMHGRSYGTLGVPGLTPAQIGGAMALTHAYADPDLMRSVWFDSSVGDWPVSARQRLDDVVGTLPGHGRGTDCALPILHAIQEGWEVDAFVLYTDGQTWLGNGHVSDALDRYRQKTSIDAKLVVCQIEANGSQLTDPKNPNHLDMAGFDASMPGVIRWFIGGED